MVYKTVFVHDEDFKPLLRKINFEEHQITPLLFTPNFSLPTESELVIISGMVYDHKEVLRQLKPHQVGVFYSNDPSISRPVHDQVVEFPKTGGPDLNELNQIVKLHLPSGPKYLLVDDNPNILEIAEAIADKRKFNLVPLLFKETDTLKLPGIPIRTVVSDGLYGGWKQVRTLAEHTGANFVLFSGCVDEPEIKKEPGLNRVLRGGKTLEQDLIGIMRRF